METVVALEQARELVRNGWCQMDAAKNSQGQGVYASSDDAAQFCISGAVARATWPWEDDEDLWEVTQECFELLARAVREQGWDMSKQPVWQVINEWNDEPARTKQECLDLFGRALRIAHLCNLTRISEEIEGGYR